MRTHPQAGTGLLIIPLIMLLAFIISQRIWEVAEVAAQLARLKKDVAKAQSMRVRKLVQLINMPNSHAHNCWTSSGWNTCLHSEDPASEDFSIAWSHLLKEATECSPLCVLSNLSTHKASFKGDLQIHSMECTEQQPCRLAASGSVEIDSLETNSPVLIVASKGVTIKKILSSGAPQLTIISSQEEVEIFSLTGAPRLSIFPLHKDLPQKPHSPELLPPYLTGVKSIHRKKEKQ